LERWRLWDRPAAYCLCGIPLVILATLTWRQSRMYADIDKLYNVTIARNPDCWMVHNNLGLALAGRGQVEAAIAHYQKALEIKPDHAAAHNNLGLALVSLGRVDEAIAHFQKVIEIEPNYADAHNNLGAALGRRGQVNEAIAHFKKALEIKPDLARAHNNLGNILADRGQVNEAIAHYRKALEIKPDFVEAYNNLGLALADRGRIDEAITHFQKALEIKPGCVDACWNLEVVLSEQKRILTAVATQRELLRSRPKDTTLLNNTAWMLATNPNASVRNGAEAVELAQRAVALSDGKSPEILATLAAAYAEAGRFFEAVQTARKALDLAIQQKKQPLANSIEIRIRLYATKMPFHESQVSPAKTSIRP
jgi:superkiller protein 3